MQNDSPAGNPRKPIIALPPNSCDSHCHVFGPVSRFPFAEERPSTPPEAPLEQLERLWHQLGFQRAVIVQSVAHGTDHAALIDALHRGNGLYRGVALVRPDTSASELARLHNAGVRGARLNLMAHLEKSAPTAEEVTSLVAKAQQYGWHISMHLSGNGIVEYEELVRSLPGQVVIDHMARVDLHGGPESVAVRTLKSLLDLGNIWVKLSGVDRLATAPPSMDDSVELARSLAAHVPERVVWGTDYPHPNTHGFTPDDTDLVETLSQVVPNELAMYRLLVANPAQLFDFASDGVPESKG